MPKNRYAHITTLQLAKICKVSQGTVDRALNDRDGINPQTKQKILAAAKKYGYSPNLNVAEIKGTHSMLYGIVLLNLNNDYFSRLIMDFEEICKKIGYNSIVMFSHNDLQTEIGCINQLVHLGVDGIVLCTVGSGEEYASYLRSKGVPIVTIGNRIAGLPFVGLNDYLAMKEMTEHRIAQACRRFVYYAPVLRKRGQENVYAQEERYRGFLDAIREANADQSTALSDGELIKELTPDRSCTVICPSDVYALRVLHLIPRGEPCNVSVTGFDDSDILKSSALSIDTVSYDRSALVEAVYNALCGRNAEEIIYIPHRITSSQKA